MPINIVSVRVNADGTIVSGENNVDQARTFGISSVTQFETGAYRIRFSEGTFTKTPTVFVSTNNHGFDSKGWGKVGDPGYDKHTFVAEATIDQAIINTVVYNFSVNTTNPSDCNFNLIAIGESDKYINQSQNTPFTLAWGLVEVTDSQAKLKAQSPNVQSANIVGSHDNFQGASTILFDGNAFPSSNPPAIVFTPCKNYGTEGPQQTSIVQGGVQNFGTTVTTSSAGNIASPINYFFLAVSCAGYDEGPLPIQKGIPDYLKDMGMSGFTLPVLDQGRTGSATSNFAYNTASETNYKCPTFGLTSFSLQAKWKTQPILITSGFQNAIKSGTPVNNLYTSGYNYDPANNSYTVSAGQNDHPSGVPIGVISLLLGKLK